MWSFMFSEIHVCGHVINQWIHSCSVRSPVCSQFMISETTCMWSFMESVRYMYVVIHVQ